EDFKVSTVETAGRAGKTARRKAAEPSIGAPCKTDEKGPTMFKTLSKGALATTLAAVCLPAPAIAGTASGSLATSATVTANCTVSTSALAFGNVDSTSASNDVAEGEGA